MRIWENPCDWGGERLDFGHLGGTSTHGDPDSWYPELWDWLLSVFDGGSVLDLGCGVGFATEFFLRHPWPTVVDGLDCEKVLSHHRLKGFAGKSLVTELFAHDLTAGPWRHGDGFRYDLVWCCELAEHLQEGLIGNLLETIAASTRRALAFCAASRGAGGFHHVNCQDPPYWVAKLAAAGFRYEAELTIQARQLCPAAYGRTEGNYFARSGLIFTR